MTDRVRLKSPGTKLTLIAAVLGAIAAPFASGQATAPQAQDAAAIKAPEFDVASVKPSKSGEGGTRIGFTMDGVSMAGVPMQMLLREAFIVEDDQILGAPSWAKSDRFDIEARVDAADAPRLKSLTLDQRRQMLQPLLADRFNLKIHHETRELPVYALMIAKSGLKMQESKPDVPGADQAHARRGTMMRPGRLESTGTSMPFLIHTLSSLLGRTIIDKTGLTGSYDFTLQWTPDEAAPMAMNPAGGPTGNPSASPPDSGPSLLTALQEQLGLKVESQKSQVDVIIIDHIEKPSEN